MGIIHDVLREITAEDDIVMEAEDITNDSRKLASQMSGGENDSSNDLSLNTENIFGNTSESGNKTNTSQENSEDTNEEDLQNEEGEDDELGDLEEEPIEENSSFDIKKKQLRSQFLHLYSTIGDDIKLMSECTPKVTTPETNEMFSTISKNLGQCRNYIHDILTDEFKISSYPILKKKFVSLRHVYDLTARAIEIHFSDKNKKDTH